MIEKKLDKQQVSAPAACCPHHKSTPRDEKELRLLQNRYCGDILVQVAAVESALQSFGYLVLQDHLETCVVEEIQKGNTQIVDEAVELIKKLK